MSDQPAKLRLQFGLRTLLEIIVVAAFILGLIYTGRNERGGGRYQMQVFQPIHGQVEVYVLDVRTGKLWHRVAEPSQHGAQWTEYPPTLPEH